MKVLQIKCPRCQQPIYSKVKDRAFYCNHCRTMHIRNGGRNVIDFDIAEFNVNSAAGPGLSCRSGGCSRPSRSTSPR